MYRGELPGKLAIEMKHRLWQNRTRFSHSLYFVAREEHILRKIDQVVLEAKQKLAKGDKKGTGACSKT